MKRLSLGLVVFAALLAGLAGVTQAAPVIDQTFDPRDSYPGGDLLAVMYRGGYFAQTFQVGVSGRLVGVDVMLSRRESMTNDLLFDVTTTMDGVPAPTLGPPSLAVIAHEQIPVDPVGTAGGSKDWVSVDLSPFEIVVSEGDVLAIVLKLDTGGFVPPDPARTFDILWSGRTMDPYPFGSIFVHPSIPGAAWNQVVGTGDTGFRTWVEPVRTVAIEVKPGGDMAPINPSSKGALPIAILGSEEFDAAQIDPASVRVNGAPVLGRPNGTLMAHLQDVSGDGRADLLLHFATTDIELIGQEAEIFLTGMTYGGVAVRGTARVETVP